MNPMIARYDALDAWRGLACLMVVVFHSIWYVASGDFDDRIRSTGGSFFDWTLVFFARFWIGVPIFFVISGYCIAASANAVGDRPRGARRYFARRIRRIYPPLMAALVLAGVVAFVAFEFFPPASPPLPFVDPRDLTAWQWLGNVTLTEEWRPALGGSPKSYLLGHTWTLCYEEQFYIIIGLLILVSKKWFFPGVGLVTGLVLLNLLDLNALVGRHIGLNLNAAQVRVPGLFINGLWLTFAAGVAVFYVTTRATPKMKRYLQLALLGLLLIGIMTEADLFDSRQTLSKFLIVGGVVALLLCWLFPFDSKLAQARCLAPLRFCGRMCYSLYLTHPLVAIPTAWALFHMGLRSSSATVFVTVPIATALSVLLARGFYVLVERRLLNSPTRHSPVPSGNEYTATESSLVPGLQPRTTPCPVAGSPCSP